ncbi:MULTISPECIES: tyrosine--tRNA ligase [Deefgea]|uniref:Tyrosine--tRNA ligase n=1 Tax=Deefgea chitinilytica TaxID=570276 RepID=A0ABS2C9C7_9NEIS|nr:MULTISPECIES: tyrosine--tRNA ligase [Deefgea]MBM5570748.1 tyrosine--tRNA ligase [Deefgea chitinilytica]MBM9887977.1 tyrosine--tRNA ligase [Deefgea sp. CFH1-16]
MDSKFDLLADLEQRGLIAQQTDAAALSKLMSEQAITLYCGFDPTADSLHIGSLVPILVLKRFQQAGHKPIALVGGATGMIGDPSFKAAERKLNTLDVIEGWVGKIRSQVSPFLSFEGDNAAIMANNHDWYAKMDILAFLRDIGKHFSVNNMINKESVKQRINREGDGISFTEFTYSLLQGYDFVVLNEQYGCQLQIGGSDQWGNITAGTDLTRRMRQQSVHGLTMPLVTKSDGTKFGKTESGTIWLDRKKTSPYKFYQFWLSTADADVYKFLRYFTFLSVAEIAAIEAADLASGKKPEAQRILAEQVTELVHGKDAVIAAERISQSLFAEDQNGLTEQDFEQLALDGLPTFELARDANGLIDVLAATELATSKSQARGFIESGAAIVNGAKVTDLTATITEADYKYGRYTLLRRGKKNHALVAWK